MKRRRNLVLAILLIASMVLSIGYAAMTDDLDFKGGAGVTVNQLDPAFEADIKFISHSEDDAIYTAGIENDGDTATFHVTGLVDKDQSVRITYTIRNENADLAAQVMVDTQKGFGVGKFNGSDENEYFSVTHDWPAAGKTIAPNGTEVITVTVTMKKMPVETVAFENVFTFGLLATAVEPAPAGN